MGGKDLARLTGRGQGKVLTLLIQNMLIYACDANEKCAGGEHERSLDRDVHCVAGNQTGRNFWDLFSCQFFFQTQTWAAQKLCGW